MTKTLTLNVEQLTSTDRYGSVRWKFSIGKESIEIAAIAPKMEEDILQWLTLLIKENQDLKAFKAEIVVENMGLKHKCDILTKFAREKLSPIQKKGVQLRKKLLDQAEDDAMVNELTDIEEKE